MWTYTYIYTHQHTYTKSHPEEINWMRQWEREWVGRWVSGYLCNVSSPYNIQYYPKENKKKLNLNQELTMDTITNENYVCWPIFYIESSALQLLKVIKRTPYLLLPFVNDSWSFLHFTVDLVTLSSISLPSLLPPASCLTWSTSDPTVKTTGLCACL